jgi:hypothetical protein
MGDHIERLRTNLYHPTKFSSPHLEAELLVWCFRSREICANPMLILTALFQRLKVNVIICYFK